MKNLTLINLDTDSITVCKESQEPFTKEEEIALLEELNSLYPDTINWDDDGSYKMFIVLKAKNYIMWDGDKLKLKGSSLKSSTLEPEFKNFLMDTIWAIIKEENNFEEIYDRYIYKIMNIKDIKQWCSKKTISTRTLESERTNESKIRDALEGVSYSEGDRFHFFFKPDGSLCLADKFDGEYDKVCLLRKLYNITKRFETILPCDTIYRNYALKKNIGLLQRFKQNVS